MSDDDGQRRLSSSVAVLPAVGLIASSPAVAWAVVPRHDVGDYFLAGPYHLNPSLERIVGGIAVVVFASSGLLAVLRRDEKTERRVATSALLLTVAVMAMAAAGWRVVTSGVDGANIGGDFIALAGPPAVALLLVVAVELQRGYRPMPRAVHIGALVTAIAVGSALMAIMWRLA